MRAVIVRSFGAPSDICVAEIPDPVPAPGQVLIRVEAIDTNYPDLLVAEGRYQVKPPLPFSPGKAAAGRIIALGAEVAGFRPGDRVVAFVEYGAYAETMVAPAANCCPIPEPISSVDAAALSLTYQTAWFALTDRAGFKAPETVLVLGAAGGVGVAGIQLAKALGARVVIGATRGASKITTVEAAGADYVLDSAMDNLRDGLRDGVRSAIGRDGVDIVLDPVGGAVTDAALRTLAWRGRLVVIGFAAGDIPTVRANYLLLKNISVCGLQWSDYRDRTPELVAEAQARIFDLALAGSIKPVISSVLPLEHYAQALEALRQGAVAGKILLAPTSGG